MKKIFLACLTAMAMCSYSYAQYDDDEYEEEDEAPAHVEKQKAAAPAKSSQKKSTKSSAPFLGIGMGFTTDFDQLNVKFKLNDQMMITAIFGLYHHGETTVEVDGKDVDQDDDYTNIAIGAGFDYFLPTPVLSTSVGGELIYSGTGEKAGDQDNLDINIMFGAHAELIQNFVLSGKAGFGIGYRSWAANANNDASRWDFGFKAGVYATWFFL